MKAAFNESTLGLEVVTEMKSILQRSRSDGLGDGRLQVVRQCLGDENFIVLQPKDCASTCLLCAFPRAARAFPRGES